VAVGVVEGESEGSTVMPPGVLPPMVPVGSAVTAAASDPLSASWKIGGVPCQRCACVVMGGGGGAWEWGWQLKA
jgi:hypothetical protein